MWPFGWHVTRLQEAEYASGYERSLCLQVGLVNTSGLCVYIIDPVFTTVSTSILGRGKGGGALERQFSNLKFGNVTTTTWAYSWVLLFFKIKNSNV